MKLTAYTLDHAIYVAKHLKNGYCSIIKSTMDNRPNQYDIVFVNYEPKITHMFAWEKLLYKGKSGVHFDKSRVRFKDDIN